MNDVDWIAILKHVTAKNVAKWVAVIAFAVFVVISLSWYAGYAWGHS